MNNLQKIFSKIYLINVKKYFIFIVILLVVFEFFLSSWPIFRGDIFYNEDIARDFLILHDVISNQKLTLIGPRILAAGGLFHGPAWIYLNLPAFLIAQGDPVIMGAFWLLLYLALLAIVYYVALKLFDSIVALFSVLLLTSIDFDYVFNNTFGAILLFPFYFYCLNKYLKTLKLKFLIIGILIAGFLIQFEIAFGAPILIITIFYLLYYLYRKNKAYHLFSLIIIIIPLSSYLLFDLRHDFIQLNSIVNYFDFNHQSAKSAFNLQTILQNRYQELSKNIQMITHNSKLLTIIFLFAYLYLLVFATKIKNIKFPHVYIFFFLLYFGFWIMTLFYKGEVWFWYYYQFIPIIVIIFCSLYRLINKKIFILLFVVFYSIGINQKLLDYDSSKNNTVGKNGSSWLLYKNIANKIYSDAPEKFGYYIHEHDLLGYRTRYALSYVEKKYKKKGYENTKMKTTYLITDHWLDNVWWKKNMVVITKKPIYSVNISNLYEIEKYNLEEQDLKISSNPNLIKSLFFR